MGFLSDFLASTLRKHYRLAGFVQRRVRALFPDQVVFLDYPVASRERWVRDRPHPLLKSIIDRNRAAYRKRLESFLAQADRLAAIPANAPAADDAAGPYWKNEWFSALDAAALYGMIAAEKPKCYLEIGSGNSTLFARRAIADLKLDTRIVSIDPQPRAAIDAVCDEVLRQPLESVPPETFDRLEAGDFLFIDSSHVVLMNSDVTALFLEILPRLKPGVFVHIHDIFLPYDYPAAWASRYYTEQYLLAALLLAGEDWLEVVLPNAYIDEDAELRSVLDPLWKRELFRGVNTGGGSFWLRVKKSIGDRNV